MNMQLEYQRQPDGGTCVQTCIAMCLGVPVDEVIKIFGKSPMGQRELLDALKKCGVVHNQFVFSTLAATGWYFACVPSLNHRGGSHQVLISWDVYEGDLQVVDPSQGIRYRDDGSDLTHWDCLVYFIPGGKLP